MSNVVIPAQAARVAQSELSRFAKVYEKHLYHGSIEDMDVALSLASDLEAIKNALTLIETALEGV